MRSDHVLEVAAYADKHGIEAAANKFNLTYETVARYKRAAKEPKRVPRILLFDIETTPVKAYVWRMWRENIRNEQIIDDWHMISWAAKWLNEPEYMSDVISPSAIKKHDDKKIVKSLYKLIDEADVIVAHAANRFDVKRMNTRFILNGLTPPSPYKVIDTLRVAKRYFAFSHNNLETLAQLIGKEEKQHTTFELWKRCLMGDREALEEMRTYNIQDVAALEDIYYALRGWIKGHPNMNLLQGTTLSCANCGNDELELKGTYRTAVREYESYRCKNCGAYSRKGIPNKTLMRSVSK